MDKVNAQWTGKMAFDMEVKGHQVRIDAKEASGGENTGPSPKIMTLLSLAGCTGMDVVSILNKMRVTFDSLDIEVTADSVSEHPRVYKWIKVKYVFSGNNLKYDKLERAVRLSQEMYCSVTAMLKKNCPVEWEIETVSR